MTSRVVVFIKIQLDFSHLWACAPPGSSNQQPWSCRVLVPVSLLTPLNGCGFPVCRALMADSNLLFIRGTWRRFRPCAVTGHRPEPARRLVQEPQSGSEWQMVTLEEKGSIFCCSLLNRKLRAGAVASWGCSADCAPPSAESLSGVFIDVVFLHFLCSLLFIMTVCAHSCGAALILTLDLLWAASIVWAHTLPGLTSGGSTCLILPFSLISEVLCSSLQVRPKFPSRFCFLPQY